jgi:glycosyltransferase involved in cell wall biosynthesis
VNSRNHGVDAADGRGPAKPWITVYSRYERLDTIAGYVGAFACWTHGGFRVRLISPLRSGVQALFPAESAPTEHRVVRYRWNFTRAVDALCRHRPATYNLYMHYYMAAAYAKSDRAGRQVLVALDPPGLAVASRVSRKRGSPVVYWPQELYPAGQRPWSDQERANIGRAQVVVGFDEERNRLLAENAGPIQARLLTVPNASLGGEIDAAGGYWHRKFGLQASTRVVMFTGGVEGPYNLLREILGTMGRWPADTVLVVHTLSGRQAVADLALLLFREGLNQRVMVSTDDVPFSELHQLFAGAHIGLALYSRSSPNHWHAGLSSGKTLQFLHCGVPVIVNDTPLLRRVIGEPGAGVCLSDPDSLPDAIVRILSDGEGFEKRARAAFRAIGCDAAQERLLEALNSLAGAP